MFILDGSYKLSVNGSGGTSFSDARYIYFEEKGLTIYIQTDKAVYKPGQNGRLITTKYFDRIFGVIKKETNIIIFTCCNSFLCESC